MIPTLILTSPMTILDTVVEPANKVAEPTEAVPASVERTMTGT